MRELKDYFCTYQQSKALMSLDCQYRWVVARYENDNDNLLVLLLRSQALDYFRELGYSGGFRGTTPYNWYLIDRPDKRIMSIKSGNYVSHVHCEKALIDKLIEIEKDARNENK